MKDHVRTQAWATWHRRSGRFSVDCTCGWHGSLWVTEWEAVEQFHDHVKSTANVVVAR